MQGLRPRHERVGQCSLGENADDHGSPIALMHDTEFLHFNVKIGQVALPANVKFRGWRRASALRLPGNDPPAAVALLAATRTTLPLYRISTTRSPLTRASVARICYAGPRLSSSNPRVLIRLAKAHHAEVKRAEASRVAAVPLKRDGPWRQPWDEEAVQETSPGRDDINNRRL